MATAWTVFKYVFALLYALNHKNAIGNWHLRFGWLCLKHTVAHKLRPRRLRAGAAAAGKRDIWESRKIKATASLGDLDYNFHKSNSTYFADADMARLDFLLVQFDDFVIGNFKDYVALGGVACSFKRQVDPYETVTLETKVLAWDEKWVYLATRFLGAKGTHKAQSVAQYVFKHGRTTIPPAKVLQQCGFDISSPEVVAKNEAQLEQARALLQVAAVADMW